MKRRLLSFLLAVLMVLSIIPTVVLPKTAVADAAPVDQAIVQGGAILHCFDWSYNEIKAALPDIAAAGYAAVQTSPVQPAKDYNGAWTDTGGNWWKLYQPLDFCVADGSETWLGSKDELMALCDEAEDYGIRVIVDVVANHTANITGGGYTVGGTYNVSDQVAERLQDPDGSKGLYHTSENGANDDSRYNMTQYHISMPDLNTGNQVVQDMVLDFLKECVDCGVDGFRFDAAKHIELPGDANCGSNFWPYVIGGIRDYAEDDLYIYGESLSGSGSDAWVNEFITYIGLTDSQTGNAARDAVRDQNAGALAIGDYSRGSSPKDYVLWAESHDTYEDNSSSGVSSDKIVRTWAIVGARADSTALYFARPNEQMGLASSDTSWKSPAVAEVNKFKTHYDGTGEYLSYDQDNKITWIERGEANNGAGVVIDKLDGAGWVELDAHLMSDGIYKDEVTGSNFAVTNGKITGYVGPTGVAVVYKTTTGDAPTPPETSSQMLYLQPSSNWNQSNARFAVYTFGGGEHWYSMSPVDGETNIYGAEITNPYTNVIFCRMNPATTDNNWNNKWNQTADLTVPSDKNWYKVTDGTWDSGGGTWDVFGDIGDGTNPIEVTEDEGYYLVGTMTGWAVLPEFKMTRTGASTEEYTIDVPLLRTSKPFHSQFKIVYSPNGVTDQTWYPGGENNNYGDYDGEIPQSGVYSVYFRPGYDGESGWHDSCIYAERSKYFVTVNDADKNGTVTVDKSIAAAGETVTVTVTPNEGYELDTLVYMCETGFNTGEFTTTEITGTTFSMPAENAAVKATFVQEGALADGYYLVPDSDPTVENINPAHRLTLFTDLDQEGHVFNYFTNYAVTGNFGENTYRIVKVEGNAIVPFDQGQAALTVTTTGVTETVYLATEPAGQYTWINDYGTGVSALTGYYLNIGNSPVPNITADYAFEETDTAGLYLFEGVLYHSDVFVCRLENGRCVARYPAGSYMDTTEVAQNLNGTPFGWGKFNRLVRIWFRPDGQGTPVGTEYMGDYGKWFHGYFLSEVLNRVIMNESEHGTVTADKMTAEEGETVTLTITPDPGYELDTLTVVNDYNEPVEVTNNTFEMTIWEAKVSATFKEAAVAAPAFKTQALALEGRIGVNFFMDLSGLSDDEKAASYMTFAITGAQPVSTDPVPFDANNTNVTGTYYGFSCYVTSIQMADTITATFHYGDGQTVTKDYSIKQYIETFEENEAHFDENTVNLVYALADYGHYVQAFLAEQKGWTLGEGGDHMEMDKYYAGNENLDISGYDYNNIADNLSEKAISRDFSDENIVKAPYTVILDSDTAIRVFFTPAAGFTGEVSAQWDDEDEVYLTRGSDGRYTIEIANIPAHLLGEMHLINVYTGEDCFKTGVRDTYTQVNVSAMSYIYSVLTSAAYASNENAKNAVSSLYAYWQAAVAFKEAE